jgi:hypothetical protein
MRTMSSYPCIGFVAKSLRIMGGKRLLTSWWCTSFGSYLIVKRTWVGVWMIRFCSSGSSVVQSSSICVHCVGSREICRIHACQSALFKFMPVFRTCGFFFPRAYRRALFLLPTGLFFDYDTGMVSQGVLLSTTLSLTALSPPTNNAPNVFCRGR